MIGHLFFISVVSLSFMGCATQQVTTNSANTQPEHQLVDSCKHTETSFRCVKVVEVYDGDSIFIDLPDQHPLFGRRMGVRILGIDTPEIKTKNSCEKKKGIAAKSVLESLVTNSKRIDIVEVQKDKYFRILGKVLVDNRSVSDELIRQRLAYSYHGEKKPKRDWCK